MAKQTIFIIDNRKRCGKCKQDRPVEEFNKRHGRDDLDSYCARCKFDYHLQRTYGKTVEWYEQKLAEQDGKCAICKQLPPVGRPLCVDHNHETGECRGLLCDLCNHALGGFRESIEILRSAVEYILQYKR